MASHSTRIVLPVVVFSLFGLYVLYPFGVMLWSSLQGDGVSSFAHYRSVLDLSNVGNLEAVSNSVIVSLITVLFSALIGFLLAFTFTQLTFPVKPLLSRFAALPVALPPLVGVIAFLFAFGETGIIPRGLRALFGTSDAPLAVNGITGIILVHVYSFHVYFYLFFSSALRNIDGSQLDAAAGMGSGAWRTFRVVMVQELRPAFIGAAALTFMASMASFTAPLIFAGGERFLTLQIYQTKLNGDLDLAAAQSVLLTSVSLVFYLLMTTASSSRAGRRKGKGSANPGVLRVSPGMRRGFMGATMVLLVLELLPVAVIVLLSFAREGSWTTQLMPSGYTFENYAALVRDPAVLEPVLNSLELALVTLAPALFFGVTAAFIFTKQMKRGVGRVATILVTLPYAVPGTAVAVALILAYNVPTFLAGGAVLVGTFWILPLAYFVREYPLIIRSTTASLETLDDTLLEAADGLGATAWMKFRAIAFPAVLPGIVSGAVLVVIAALGEFVSSILLYTYANRPISVEILAQLRLFNIGAAAAYSVLLMIIILVLLSIGDHIARQRVEEMREGMFA